MAAHVVVQDAALKQTRVNVTPSKSLQEVLQDACKVKSLDPASYTLKTAKGKTLDLSQPFRFSGLAPGAKLQLIQASRSAGVVDIALQLPESEGGSRFSDKFPSTTSIWFVLRKFEEGVAGQSQRKLNITQRAVPSKQLGSGRLMYEMPVVNLLQRHFESFDDLQKTLSQLGLNSGNALIRLSFKPSDQPLEEAMQEIEQYFSSLNNPPTTSSVAPDASGLRTAPTANAESQPMVARADLVIQPQQPVVEDLVSTEGEAVEPTNLSPLSGATQSESAKIVEYGAQSSASNTINGISVYRAPTGNTPAAALQADDQTVFEPTIETAKAHQAALERAGRNTRLLSDKELEEQDQARQAKLALVQEVEVRVRYPDQMSIRLTVRASETANDLYAKLRDTFENAAEAFELRYLSGTGQWRLLPDSATQRLVKDFGFRGKMMVNLAWPPGSSGTRLRREFIEVADVYPVNLVKQEVSGSGGGESNKSIQIDQPAPKAKGDIESKLRKMMGFKKK